MLDGPEIGVAFAVVALLASPTSAQTPHALTPGSGQSAHRLLDVPYLPQTPELCGGAAVAMVMRYWGDRTVLPMDFQSLVRSPAGIVTTDLVRAVAARGWSAFATEAPIDAAMAGLQREVDQGRPVIAMIASAPGRFHYVVVVGVTSDARVVLHDPARTSFRVVAWDDFDRDWRASHRWQLLVLPTSARVGRADRADAPASAPAPAAAPARASAPAPAVSRPRNGACGAMVDHAVAEAETDPAAAEAALDAASELCPTEADPWLELAGLRFHAQQWREAGDLAERATRLDGTNEDAWALLGTSRLLDNDDEAALAAWNHIGEPLVDAITITGADRTPQPALMHLIGLTPRTLLTPAAFARASRNLGDAPTADATRLAFAPTGDGRATVSASMVEREVLPRQPIALTALAVRGVVSDDLRVMTSGLVGQGETITADWRWPEARPRLGGILSLPAPVPLNGVVTIDGFWERQSYGLSGADDTSTVVQDTRRRLAFNLGDWLSGRMKIDLGGGIDRFGDADYASLHGAVEEHLGGDRLIARADGEIWRLGGEGFSTQAFSLTWTNTTDMTHPSVSTLAGYAAASEAAPRALWMGAGTGQGRPILLRAHPLLDEDVVRGPVFGRQIAFSTSEFDYPMMQRLFGTVSAAVFVDAAQAWRTLSGDATSPFELDAGVGFRLRLSRSGGSARVDLGHGLRDGGTVLSAGWSTSATRLFSRGMPW